MEGNSLMKLNICFDRMNKIYFPKVIPKQDIVYLTIQLISNIPSKINFFSLHTDGKIQLKHLDKLNSKSKVSPEEKLIMDYEDNIGTTEEMSCLSRNIGSNLFFCCFKIEPLLQIGLLESFLGYYLDVSYKVEIKMDLQGNSKNKDSHPIQCTDFFYVNIPVIFRRGLIF